MICTCSHAVTGHDGPGGACSAQDCSCTEFAKASGANNATTVTLAADPMMPADGEPGASGGPADLPGGVGWNAPIFIPEGVETSDGRMIEPGALTCRALPLPLWVLTDGPHGTEADAPLVGRFDLCSLAGNVWTASGVFEDSDLAVMTADRARAGFCVGISADIAVQEMELRVTEVDEQGNVIAAVEVVTRGEIIGGTIVPDPAFADARVEVVDTADGPDVLDPLEPGDVLPIVMASAAPRVSNDPYCAPCSGSLRASAGLDDPPADWFTDPHLDGPTPLTITDDGRVYGHLASWQTCHTGVSGSCVVAPRSEASYAYYKTGAVRCADGSEVATGPITMNTGHAGLSADASSAAAHYDHTGTAVADVAAGEDAHGIWLAGALRPGVTKEQVRILRASALSGDWRRIGRALELVAALAVNTPGFPLSRVASGAPVALVAAGGVAVVRRAEPWREELATVKDELAAWRRQRDAEKALALIRGRQGLPQSAAELGASEQVRPVLLPIHCQRERWGSDILLLGDVPRLGDRVAQVVQRSGGLA